MRRVSPCERICDEHGGSGETDGSDSVDGETATASSGDPTTVASETTLGDGSESSADGSEEGSPTGESSPTDTTSVGTETGAEPADCSDELLSHYLACWSLAALENLSPCPSCEGETSCDIGSVRC